MDGKITKIEKNTGKKRPPRAGMGRPPGSPNKTTASLKAAILEAFDEIGGAEWLKDLAESDPKAFVSLLARLIPSEVSADITSTTLPGLPDNLTFVPENFPSREAWDSFFDMVKRTPGSVALSGEPMPDGYDGDVFPIVRFRGGQWYLGGNSDPRTIACNADGEVLFIDPDPDI